MASGPSTITVADFDRVEMRGGRIISAMALLHPDRDVPLGSRVF